MILLGMGGGRGGGRGADVPPIGQVLDVKGGVATMQIVSEVQKSVAIPKLPKSTNKALKHDAAGVIGYEVLRRFAVTFDHNRHALFLDPYPGRVAADPYDRSGVWVERHYLSIRMS